MAAGCCAPNVRSSTTDLVFRIASQGSDDMPLATSRHLELISPPRPTLGSRARANAGQFRVFLLLAEPDFRAVFRIGRRVVVVTWAPSTRRTVVPASKGPTYSSSLRRGPERKTSHRGRVCGRRRTRSGGGRLLLGINDQSFIWPNSRGRMGNLALGLTWQICQGGRATGDFYQIVNYPFRTARAKQPNLPLGLPFVGSD